MTATYTQTFSGVLDAENAIFQQQLLHLFAPEESIIHVLALSYSMWPEVLPRCRSFCTGEHQNAFAEDSRDVAR
jgi:hypothetical protein